MDIIRSNCDLLLELIDRRNIREVFMALGDHFLMCNWTVECSQLINRASCYSIRTNKNKGLETAKSIDDWKIENV